MARDVERQNSLSFGVVIAFSNIFRFVFPFSFFYFYTTKLRSPRVRNKKEGKMKGDNLLDKIQGHKIIDN